MITEDIVAKAMQEVWDDFCADTGCIPTAFRVHGPRSTRVSANFIGADFCYKVAQVINRLSEEGLEPCEAIRNVQKLREGL